MKGQKNIPDSLLGKYSSSADKVKEEIRFIPSIIEEDEDVLSMINDIKQIDKDIEKLQLMSQIDTSAALDKVKGRIKSRNKLKTIYTAWQKIAAVLILPILTVSLYQILQYNEEEQHIVWNESSSMQGMTSKVFLPDGSIVELNSCSKLRYPSKFDENQRVVELEGEGFFKVKSDKENPFLVRCNGINVQAVGTAFNVLMSGKGEIITSLAEGTVNIIDESSKEKIITLTPGQTAIYNSETECLAEVNTTDIDKYLGWREGKMIFRSDNMADVLEQIERKYNVEFIVTDNTDMSGRFTGTFVGKSLETVLNFISMTTSVAFEIHPERTDEIRTINVHNK